MLVGLLAVVAAMLIAPASAGATPSGTSRSASSQQLPKPRADIVVDADSGRILTCDNIHEAMHPASTAKIMTAVVAAERLSANATITANAQDAQVETMRIGLPVGKAWPMDQVMASLMMVSANDSAYAIAHTIGGSLDNFATILNNTGHRLGLKDSTLGDPAGLDDTTSYNGGPTMSAYDLAVATRNALSVPAIAKWASTHYYEFDDVDGIHHRLTNHNPMLPGGDYAYTGATGFKTGFTDKSQHSLVATATRDGHTFIAVILGAVDGGYAEAAQMLDTAFANASATPSATSSTGAAPACAGETLPPVAVSLYDARASDRDAFSHLADMPAALAGTDNAGVPASIPVLSSPPHAAPARTVVTKKHSGSGLFSLRNFALILVVLIGTVIALRHRAVKRQRAMRMARRRQRMAAMRSGGLPVVDGRYRTGTRLGPPIESHVRVRRLDEHVDPIEAELDALDV